MSRSSFITVCMSLLAAMAQLGAAPRALAQITDRTIEQIKTESLLRAERGAYPLGGLDLQDVRDALSRISTRDPDEWAGAWSAVADRYASAARAESDPARAASARLRPSCRA